MVYSVSGDFVKPLSIWYLESTQVPAVVEQSKMPAVDFTVRYLQGLRPRDKAFDVFDAKVRGFGIRVSPGGTKTFFLRYRTEQGRLRKLMLGPVRGLSLADARSRALKVLAEVQQGVDPQGRLQDARAAETVAEAAEKFIIYSHENNRPRTAAEDERYLRKELLPTFGRWKLKDLRRRDIIALLEQVKNRKQRGRNGAPVAANRLHQVISRLFEFAVNREIVEVNPVYRLRKLTCERPRQRILSPEEIKALLQALNREGDQPLAEALRLTLMLARRRSEVLGWRWDEIDGGIWTIPAERSKNKRAVPVPLPKQALAILEELARQRQFPSPYIFPSPRKPETSYGEPKKAFQRIRKESGLEHFTIHDLRRTAASRMRTLGIPREDIEAILGHAEGRLVETYHCEYPIERMKRSLQRWVDYLDQLIDAGESGEELGKVVPFRRGIERAKL